MKKVYVLIILILLVIIAFLKPIKVQIILKIPNELEGMSFNIKIRNKEYENYSNIWLFPGRYNIEVKLNKNKINREFRIPYLSFSKKTIFINLEKPIINVNYERKDYDEIWIYLESKNYKLDYWKIYFNEKEYKTTLSVYKLYTLPYLNGILKVSGYLQNKEIFSKKFNIQTPLSKIKDYNIKIDDYINISLELEHNKVDPIKYEIYKNNKFIDTFNTTIYRDKFTYDKVIYKIIPIYPSGYKGKGIEILKPVLPEIPEKINKKVIKMDKIIEYSPKKFVEGENNVIFKINEKIYWYKKIYVDTTPPKLENYSLKYDKIYTLKLVSNEKSVYELITDEKRYRSEENTIEFTTFSNEATLFIYDDLNNASQPILINLNPFPRYEINEFDNSVSFKFEKDFIADFCELRILDEEDDLITKIDIRKLSEFTFSNFLPGKEYKFILYIDDKFNKEIYKKIIPPKLPVIKSIRNIEIGTFEINILDDYKYNFYKVELDDFVDKGTFSGNILKLNLPLEKLTKEGTLEIWREFKGLKTEKLKFNIRDNFLFGKKLFYSLEKISSGEYIIPDNINIKNLDIDGLAELYVFPGKSIIINGSINFSNNKSKLIIKALKDEFEGIILNTGNLKNVEIYNANIGITINNNFNLYNLVIKNCKVGLYEKSFSGTAYNIILSDNKKGIEIIDGNVEIKNSLFFDNEISFSFYNSKAYLYNIYVVESKLDVDVYNSNLKIKTSDFLNSNESINSANSDIFIDTITFKNNNRTIKSREDRSLIIQNAEFINNKISLDIFKSPFYVNSSKFVNNEKGLTIFNSTNDKELLIKDTIFEDNLIDIYINGSNDVYLENTRVTNFYDGNIEPTWVNERGKIFNRGKIIFKGGKE
ncbi:hypothetical protein JCM30566_05810 [Marinitoga arctica]